MTKEHMKDLLVIGYGIVLYVMMYSLVYDASDLLPECKIYHESQGVCEQWEKTPGQSVIQ